MRQKYVSVVWLKAESPESANMVILAFSKTGATAVACPPGPRVPAKFEVVARDFVAAATPSAGSPLSSIAWQVALCPRTPPAWLISTAAVEQPAICSGPREAFGPVYVEKLPIVMAPPEWPPLPPAEFELPLLPQPASTTPP